MSILDVSKFQMTYAHTTLSQDSKFDLQNRNIGKEYSFLQNIGIIAQGPVCRPYIQRYIQKHSPPFIIWPSVIIPAPVLVSAKVNFRNSAGLCSECTLHTV